MFEAIGILATVFIVFALLIAFSKGSNEMVKNRKEKIERYSRISWEFKKEVQRISQKNDSYNSVENHMSNKLDKIIRNFETSDQGSLLIQKYEESAKRLKVLDLENKKKANLILFKHLDIIAQLAAISLNKKLYADEWVDLIREHKKNTPEDAENIFCELREGLFFSTYYVGSYMNEDDMVFDENKSTHEFFGDDRGDLYSIRRGTIIEHPFKLTEEGMPRICFEVPIF